MRGRLRDHLMYHWDKIAIGVQNLLLKTLVAVSFIMLAFYFVYVVYFSTVCYSMSRVITGCLSLCVMIHLNKSLQGR